MTKLSKSKVNRNEKRIKKLIADNKTLIKALTEIANSPPSDDMDWHPEYAAEKLTQIGQKQ